jgi:misacylated tRNA(Ala) deacylase
MTELIYLEDAYARAFEARIMQVSDLGLALDRTAFYPGGGGQPHDVGEIRAQKDSLQVDGMKKADGEIWHHVPPHEFSPGEPVQGLLDWERRYQLMRVHTAMHILCGVIWRDYGASVTGGNMEPLKGRMDFEF